MNYICRQPCCGELVLGPRNLKELNRPAASRARVALQGRMGESVIIPVQDPLEDHCISILDRSHNRKRLRAHFVQCYQGPVEK